jgi:hypothetical protein
MVNPMQKVERQRDLGTEGDSSVYAGELTGISLALRHANWLEGQGQLVRKVTILSDSQAAIQAVVRPGRPSGQYILSDIYIRARTLQEAGANLQV